MSQPWTFEGAPDPHGGGQITLMEGTTFCISDARGDVGAHRVEGLFVRDTRIVSRWCLQVVGRELDTLRVHQDTPHDATFLLLAPDSRDDAGDALLVTRERFVGDGMLENISLWNISHATARVELELHVDADFADLFEVKEGRAHHEEFRRVVHNARLDLSLLRGGAEFGVTISADPSASVDSGRLRWGAVVPAQGTWTATVRVVARLRGTRLEPHHRPGLAPEHAEPARRQRTFRRSVPVLESGDAAFTRVLERSIDDLATLRIFDPDRPELPVIAAGAPWFMALFGRDSLITSLMLLPMDRSLALGTLTTLGAHQGSRRDPPTEEEPGRIVHELRFGPAATLALGGKTAYFGSVDATPLFVMAVGELLHWAPSLVTPELLAQVDRALEWITRFGDRDGDRFVEYSRHTKSGLANQGWKDSWDAINFADGRVAEAPIALAEVQGYVYAAFLAGADLAEMQRDGEAAAEWRDRAAHLKKAFNDTFWLPEHGWYAVGLDRGKRPIDSLTSNNGHCLWTGIADEDKAATLAGHLLSPEMFSGWGIRTLGVSMGAYNPMSYHNGSVWPHDTALCVAGLARYGYAEQAAEVATGLLDAATHFGDRLPELFAGFPRKGIPVPVPYPAACSPQAWAAAAPVEVLTTMLGLRPDGATLACDPTVPSRLLPLALRNLDYRGERYDIEIDAHGWAVNRGRQTAGPAGSDPHAGE